MAATDQQILDALRDGILRLATNQILEYEFSNKRFEYQDIWKLQKIADLYEDKIARADGGTRPIMILGDVSRRAV